jgi:hypothetical protein
MKSLNLHSVTSCGQARRQADFPQESAPILFSIKSALQLSDLSGANILGYAEGVRTIIGNGDTAAAVRIPGKANESTLQKVCIRGVAPPK